ncbi:hypothetical protein L195_g012394, partial [Trifolium pratense]
RWCDERRGPPHHLGSVSAPPARVFGFDGRFCLLFSGSCLAVVQLSDVLLLFSGVAGFLFRRGGGDGSGTNLLNGPGVDGLIRATQVGCLDLAWWDSFGSKAWWDLIVGDSPTFFCRRGMRSSVGFSAVFVVHCSFWGWLDFGVGVVASADPVVFWCYLKWGSGSVVAAQRVF